MSPLAEEFKDLVKQKKWGDAEALLESHDVFPELIQNYNLALVKTKLEKFAEARFTLEVARKQGFINKESNQLLDSITNSLGITRISSEYSLKDNLVLNLKPYYDSALVLIPVILSFLVVLGLIKKVKSILFIAVFLFCFSIGSIYELSKGQMGIAMESIPVREGPSKMFEQTQEVPAGMKVIYHKSEIENWYQIEYPEYLKGWFQPKSVKHL